MRNLHKHILERGAAPAQFPHGPVAVGGQPENFLAHIRPGFDSQRKLLPIAIDIHHYVAHAGNFLQLFRAPVCAPATTTPAFRIWPSKLSGVSHAWILPW